MDINDFHVGVGHLHEGLLQDTAEQMGVTLTGEFSRAPDVRWARGTARLSFSPRLHELLASFRGSLQT